MLQVRRIIQLKQQGKSNRNIAREVGLSRDSVSFYIRRIEKIGLSLGDLFSFDYLDDCFFLTIKPVIYVCNVDEATAVSGNVHTDIVKPAIEKESAEMIVIAALAEAEIAQLTEEENRLAFLKELWLNEPGVEKLIRSAYRALNLQTFFTEGPNEVRAWTIRQGTIAQKAAGVIHSDLERGFIRAEVKRWEDFVQLGSEHACKQAGKFHIEGKINWLRTVIFSM